MSYVITVSLIAMLSLWIEIRTFAQTNTIAQSQIARSEVQKVEGEAASEPAFSAYRGISIGTSADEVRERIDEKPLYEDEDGYFYVFSDEESAQFVLGDDRNVKLMSITYSGKNSNAPTYEDVFGKDIPLKTNRDGNVYNLVDYPEAGFWVAYYSSTGNNPIVTITIQKL
jgi:hypothetical protein